MAHFSMTEIQALNFHRAILDRLGDDPAFLGRAREMLAILCRGKSGTAAIWDDWAVIVDLDLPGMKARLLEDTPRAGLLRAHSPLVAALDPGARNQLWQTVGLGRFVGHVLGAARALGLDGAETEAVLGIAVETLEIWQRHPPTDVPGDGLERMKSLVGIRHALETLFDAAVVRRGWLRTPSADLAAVPFDLMCADIPADGLGRVHAHLSEAMGRDGGAHVAPADLPRMG